MKYNKLRILRIIETICVIGIIVCLIIVLIGAYRNYQQKNAASAGSEWQTLHNTRTKADHSLEKPGDSDENAVSGQNVPEVSEENVYTGPEFDMSFEDPEVLTEGVNYLPENLAYGKKLPVTVFYDKDGAEVNIEEICPEKTLVLMYWGSWCKYCDEQLKNINEFISEGDGQSDIRVILINKTDESKDECVEKAEKYLADNNITFSNYYDIDLKAYEAYGAKLIPTTIVLDEERRVRAMKADVIKDNEEFQELLAYAEHGNLDSLQSFIINNMMNDDKGIYTEYNVSDYPSPSGHDVLSESMGLWMQSAVDIGDKQLFDEAYEYVENHMLKKKMYEWYVDDRGKPAGANALLDDMRIWSAIMRADKLWGGYSEKCMDAMAIIDKTVYKKKLSSYYVFGQRKAGDNIALCYGDLETLDMAAELALANNDDKKQQEILNKKDAMMSIMKNGYISNSVPLYHSMYYYNTKQYGNDPINTSEQLVLFYQLAKADMLPEASVNWLRKKLENENLYARYDMDGNVCEYFNYQSTASYGLAALVSMEIGDADMYMKALYLMEKTRVKNKESQFYGAFSHKDDGSDIIAFDQLIPLTVYSKWQEVKFD